MLSRGRSFRTAQATELIGPAGKTFQVFAETFSESSKTSRIGLERSKKHWRARKDGQSLSQLSQLTCVLPLVLMEPNSHLLVSGTPEVRRKFLDWGMFHVEHEFLRVSRGFSKILKQRNAALRANQEELLDSMDLVFCDLGVKLGQLRKAHSEAVAEQIQVILTELSAGLDDVRFEYRKGWTKGTLPGALAGNRKNDLIKGATGAGPHRADIALIHQETPARAVLSRGEQKTLASAMLLSQADILARQHKTPVLLLDDLASEFDSAHYQSVLNRALKVGGQVWVSGTGKQAPSVDHKMFHVKHGEVEEVV